MVLQIMIEQLVVCSLAILQSGMLNKCLNCTGDREATGVSILEREFLNEEFFDQMLVEMQQLSRQIE